MGFNDDMFRDPVIVDVETAAHACASEFIEPLDLNSITAAKNLVDPAKIAADIAKRRAEAQSDHDARIGRAALDWNLSRIVALGWSTDGGDTVVAMPCADEAEEVRALTAFWRDARGMLLGFAARTFDLPTLIQRSRLLRVPMKREVNLARFGKGSVIDLRDVLTFEDARYEALMPRSLKMFCRRFGIPVEDEIDGSDIGALVAAGDWDAVVRHVTSDVRLTAALARRIGVLEANYDPPEPSLDIAGPTVQERQSEVMRVKR